MKGALYHARGAYERAVEEYKAAAATANPALARWIFCQIG
jgi:hypothetical protein